MKIDLARLIWLCPVCGGTVNDMDVSPTKPRDGKDSASGQAPLALGGERKQKDEPLAELLAAIERAETKSLAAASAEIYKGHRNHNRYFLKLSVRLSALADEVARILTQEAAATPGKAIIGAYRKRAPRASSKLTEHGSD